MLRQRLRARRLPRVPCIPPRGPPRGYPGWGGRERSGSTPAPPPGRPSRAPRRPRPVPLRGRLDATRVVVRGAVDEAAHRVGLHLFLGERREQASQLVSLGGGVEPRSEE